MTLWRAAFRVKAFKTAVIRGGTGGGWGGEGGGGLRETWNGKKRWRGRMKKEIRDKQVNSRKERGEEGSLTHTQMQWHLLSSLSWGNQNLFVGYRVLLIRFWNLCLVWHADTLICMNTHVYAFSCVGKSSLGHMLYACWFSVKDHYYHKFYPCKIYVISCA